MAGLAAHVPSWSFFFFPLGLFSGFSVAGVSVLTASAAVFFSLFDRRSGISSTPTGQIMSYYERVIGAFSTFVLLQQVSEVFLLWFAPLCS